MSMGLLWLFTLCMMIGIGGIWRLKNQVCSRTKVCHASMLQ